MKKMMFNDGYGLTCAVLDGRKTMTRRLAEKELVEDENCELRWNGKFKPARFKVGEVVAVAQSYASIIDELENPKNYCCMEAWEFGQRKVGKYIGLIESPGFSNKMFVLADLMPHQIRITDVRAERLQDISEEDCLREGIYEVPFCEFAWEDNGKTFKTAREAFAALIDMVSGKGTWANNPFIYAYTFELIHHGKEK